MKLRGRVVTPSGIVPDGVVRIDDGRIADVTPALSTDTDQTAAWILPGFVDIHVHGGGGHTFTTGNPDEALATAQFHRRHGTTTMLASLVTAPPAQTREAVAALAELVHSGDLAGVHLEGPYLSTARCGAHNPAYLRDPDPAELSELLPWSLSRRSCPARSPRSDSCVPMAWSPRSATPTPPTNRRRPRSRQAPASPPICATRCGRCTTGTPARSWPCLTPRAWCVNRSRTGSTCTTACSRTRYARLALAGWRWSRTRWRRPACPTASTNSAGWRSGWPAGRSGWRRPARLPAARSPWTLRCATPSRVDCPWWMP